MIIYFFGLISKKFCFCVRVFKLRSMLNYGLIILASMTPLIEFRFAIPFGASLGVPVWKSVLLATIGALVATKLVLWLLPKFVDFARKKSPWIDKKLAHIFKKAHSVHSKKMKRVGRAGIIFFVMLPIPGSGVYTAALLAYLFNWPFWKSWISISLVLISFWSVSTLFSLLSRSLRAGSTQLLKFVTATSFLRVSGDSSALFQPKSDAIFPHCDAHETGTFLSFCFSSWSCAGCLSLASASFSFLSSSICFSMLLASFASRFSSARDFLDCVLLLVEICFAFVSFFSAA